jgi:MFS family permease
MEGATAAALPWMVAQATLGTPWLGAASAGLVLSAMLGTLIAPLLEHRLGNRRMTVLTAFAVVAALVAAALCWVGTLPAPAYGFVLLAMAADAASDLGFASRMPLLARLSAQRLEQFSGANWLWGIGGAAAGSVVAGWALSAHTVIGLAVGLVSLSLVVAIGLALLLPREPRLRVNKPPMKRALLDRQFWTAAAKKVAVVLIAVVFFAGPIDNLLLPAHLAARGLHASTFGDMLAAVGLGLAAGLWWTQARGSRGNVAPPLSSIPTGDGRLRPASGRSTPNAAPDPANKRRAMVVWGLLGLAGQLGLMLWLPQQWLLLTGLFLSAALFAPLLPMLEAAMLTAARPAQRTLMLAALSTLVAVADVLGTLSLGALVSCCGSAVALGVCLGAACVAAVACSVWPRQRRSDKNGVET